MLNELQNERLEKVTSDLDSLAATLTVDKRSTHFIEASAENDNFEIYANSEGLIFLASHLLKLARDRIDGKHLHVDEAGMLDSGEPFVIGYQLAPWDSREAK